MYYIQRLGEREILEFRERQAGKRSFSLKKKNTRGSKLKLTDKGPKSWEVLTVMSNLHESS